MTSRHLTTNNPGTTDPVPPGRSSERSASHPSPTETSALSPDGPSGHGRPRRRRSVAPLISGELVLRHVRVRPHDVVYLKGVLEASEGLAAVFAERGGDLTIATTTDQQVQLDRVLLDLRQELPILFAEESADSKA